MRFPQRRKIVVDCKLRDDNQHEDPCGECAQSFQVFADSFKLYDNILKRLQEQGAFDHDKIMLDDMLQWEEDLTDHFNNFLDYRRHIAQAEDEAAWDKLFCGKLADGECIIIMDFKMKILASMYREKQKDWFSKRGFSCLGVLIIFGSSKESNEVLYHLFFSNDTTQDSDYVNTVKE